MNLLIKYTSILLLVIVFMTSCQKKEQQEAHTEHSGQMYTCPMHPQIMEPNPGSCPICGMDLVAVSQTQGEGGIMLSANQIKLANIRAQVLTSGSIGNSTLLTATTVADKNLLNQISSRISGRIEKLYVKQVGEQISKGTPLYDLYSEALLTLEQEYLVALAQQKALGGTDENYSRILQGAKEKLFLYGMSEKQLEELTSSGKAKPTVTFYSQGRGIVEEIAVSEGQYIAEGSAILKISDLSSLWVEAQLYPAELPQAKIGSTVDVRINGFGNEVVKGKVVFLAPELASNSKIIIMRAQIDNPQMKFIPGMQASVTLTNDSKKALTLPINAVIRDEQGSYVWKQIGKSTFSPVMVKLGSENTSTVEVISGLSESDTVVVSGAYLLHSEYILKKGGNPMSGHDHGQMASAESPKEMNQSQMPSSLATQIPDYSSADREFKTQIEGVYKSYISLKNALVESNVENTKKAAQEILAAMGKIDATKLSREQKSFFDRHATTIKGHAKGMASASSIDDQRKELDMFSKSMYALLQSFKAGDESIYYQYCPMANSNKGAYWVSERKEIRNPYYGESMLTCGETKETFNPK